jgi:hypothetical protein
MRGCALGIAALVVMGCHRAPPDQLRTAPLL